MSRFNHYFNNHFAGCRLLAYARDTNRERDVRIYMVPGEQEAVGITDGTDCWIAPVVRGAQYFKRVDTWQLLQDIFDGKDVPKPVPLELQTSGRRRVALDEAEPQAVPQGRRRVALEEEPQPSQRRRHVPSSF